MKILENSGIHITLESIARGTCTWPIAATAAFKSSTRMAISRSSFSSMQPMTRRDTLFLGTCLSARPDETAPWTICITNGTDPVICTPRMRNPAESINSRYRMQDPWQVRYFWP